MDLDDYRTRAFQRILEGKRYEEIKARYETLGQQLEEKQFIIKLASGGIELSAEEKEQLEQLQDVRRRFQAVSKQMENLKAAAFAKVTQAIDQVKIDKVIAEYGAAPLPPVELIMTPEQYLQSLLRPGEFYVKPGLIQMVTGHIRFILPPPPHIKLLIGS